MQQNPSQPKPVNTAVHNQELIKKQQFEEQKRKLKELSSKGGKSKRKDGNNMLNDLMSKADLGLSARSHSSGIKSSGTSRPTNVFTGKLKLS